MNKKLEKYYVACSRLAQEFIKELGGSKDEAGAACWIGKEVGGVLHWRDYFFSMEDIVEYFRLGYTPELFFEWYDRALEEIQEGKEPINMRQFFIKNQLTKNDYEMLSTWRLIDYSNKPTPKKQKEKTKQHPLRG